MKKKSGETIVEIMASALIFLLLMAVLQGAVAFASRAQEKSRQLRSRNEAMFQALQSTLSTPDGSHSYVFYACDEERGLVGENPVFSIAAGRGKKHISYTDKEGNTGTAEFAVFGGGGS